MISIARWLDSYVVGVGNIHWVCWSNSILHGARPVLIHNNIYSTRVQNLLDARQVPSVTVLYVISPYSQGALDHSLDLHVCMDCTANILTQILTLTSMESTPLLVGQMVTGTLPSLLPGLVTAVETRLRHTLTAIPGRYVPLYLPSLLNLHVVVTVSSISSSWLVIQISTQLSLGLSKALLFELGFPAASCLGSRRSLWRQNFTAHWRQFRRFLKLYNSIPLPVHYLFLLPSEQGMHPCSCYPCFCSSTSLPGQDASLHKL